MMMLESGQEVVARGKSIGPKILAGHHDFGLGMHIPSDLRQNCRLGRTATIREQYDRGGQIERILDQFNLHADNIGSA